MKLIDRYVLRELVLPFCIGGMTAILILLGTMLFSSAEVILRYRVPVLLVLEWLAYRLPDLATQGLPMGMAFAVALAVNRLARDNEVTPMRMAGVPFRRIAAPLFCAGLAASLAAYLCADRLTPWAHGQADRVEGRMLGTSALPPIRSGAFVEAGRYGFYISRAGAGEDGGHRMQDVLIYDRVRSGVPVWYYAREADGRSGRWVLKGVVRHDLGADGMTETETYLPELTLDLGEDVDLLARPRTRAEMTSAELRSRARQLAAAGASDATLFLVDYHFRFAYPLACLVFGMIAAPVSLRFSRGGTFAGVLVSVVIAFLYWNAMFLARLLGYNDVLPATLAAWMPDILFAALAGILLLGADGRLPWVRRCRPSGQPAQPRAGITGQ